MALLGLCRAVPGSDRPILQHRLPPLQRFVLLPPGCVRPAPVDLELSRVLALAKEPSGIEGRVCVCVREPGGGGNGADSTAPLADHTPPGTL